MVNEDGNSRQYSGPMYLRQRKTSPKRSKNDSLDDQIKPKKKKSKDTNKKSAKSLSLIDYTGGQE